MRAHLVAIATILVWSFTFISTKVLLQSFLPVEILFIRFLMGFAALWLIHPHVLRLQKRSHEWLFVAAGASGVTLYYLLENVALVYTTASNVGVIVSAAPLFVAIIARAVGREKDALGPRFLAGFAIAITGIALISFRDQGTEVATFGPLGDLLGVGAAVAWGVYSNVLNRISELGYQTIPATRRLFMWGLLFMVPMLPIMGAQPDLTRLADPVNLGNLLFLGLGASAGCFVTWNYALSKLGATRASVYIYLTPVITVLASVAILGEPMTWVIALGTILTLVGLFVSSWKRAE